MGECGQQKHTQHAPSTKVECDYLNCLIKKNTKQSYRLKSHPKWCTPEIEQRRPEKEKEGETKGLITSGKTREGEGRGDKGIDHSREGQRRRKKGRQRD